MACGEGGILPTLYVEILHFVQNDKTKKYNNKLYYY